MASNSGLNPNSPSAEEYGISSYFFENYSIDLKDWSKVFGYEFVIYGGEFGSGGQTSSVDKQAFMDLMTNDAFKKMTKGAPSFKASWVRLPLPITPQALSIETPSAVNTTVTMKGITEDHNGAPLRYITIRGRAGVLHDAPPSNLSGGNPSAGSVIAQQVFKNTIKQAARIKKAVSDVLGNSAQYELNPSRAELDNLGARSGYNFIHSLIRFLDFYLEIKKMPKYAKTRLSFRMHKDRMYWDCTLNGYSVRKVAGSLDYEYEIRLTAWRRNTTEPAKGAFLDASSTRPKELTGLTKAIQKLRQTRRALFQATNFFAGIRADIRTSLIGPMKELFLIGNAINVGIATIADFPQSVQNELQSSYTKALTDFRNSRPKKYSEIEKTLKKSGISGTTPVDSIAFGLGGVSLGALDTAINESEVNGQATLVNPEETASSLDGLLADDLNSQEFLDEFDLSDLSLTPDQQELIQNEQDRAASLTTDDLILNRDRIASFASSISAYMTNNRNPTIDDIILLNYLNEMIQGYDSFINYYRTLPKTASVDYYEYYAELMKSNEVTFQQSQSKFYIPFPYGATLEQLAYQYLGDASRWIEIAAINGLRAPYIDEVGFIIPFKSSGSGNSVIVAAAENIYIGQTVEIFSDTQRAVPKKITNISVVDSINTVITFSGDPDLNKFTITDNAKIKAFKPDTVNYLKLIAIPSDSPVNLPGQMKLTPSPEDLDYLTSIAKVDFLLQSDGDLVVGSYGDIALASGLQNITQAAYMKLLTRKGALLNDPDFGNPLQAGASVSEFTAQQVLDSLNSIFNSDPRFNGVLVSRLDVKGPSAKLDILLGISNVDVNLPLSTQLPI